MDQTDGNIKYLRAKNELKDMILNNKIKGKLPGGRALSKEFGLSYMTLRKAIKELVNEGYLRNVEREGTFVVEPRQRYKKTFNIGFYLAERITDGISSPYYSLILKKLGEEINKNGYHIILLTNIENIVNLKDERNVDGIIATCFPENKHVLKEISRFMPMVLIDNHIKYEHIPAVLIDNFYGTYKAVKYLIETGHRDIAYVTGTLDYDIGYDKLEGYKKALIDNNIPVNNDFVYEGSYVFESGYSSIEHFLALPKRPTAFVCGDDSIAFGVLKGLNEKGINVPEEVSIVGFDDLDLCLRIHPSLTTVKSPLGELASQCVKYIIKSINNEEFDLLTKLLPTKLIVRESTKPPH